VYLHLQEGLAEALDAIIERTQDFTDSANTSHDHRERILELVQASRSQLESVLDAIQHMNCPSTEPDAEQEVETLLATLGDLRKTLQAASFAQVCVS